MYVRTLILILMALLVSLKVPLVASSLEEVDLGLIGACERPTLTICRGSITHEVPASIAKQAAILEFYLEMIVNEKDDGCREVLTRALCMQRFPKCSQIENQVAIVMDANCQNVIQSRCNGSEEIDKLLKGGLCRSFSSTLYDGNCRTLEEHLARTSKTLGECSLLADSTQLTDWMFHFLTRIDVGVENTNSYPQCSSDHVLYQCSYGYCENGRVESRNTQDRCESVLDW